jgi:hypothetical protein
LPRTAAQNVVCGLSGDVVEKSSRRGVRVLAAETGDRPLRANAGSNGAAEDPRFSAATTTTPRR